MPVGDSREAFAGTAVKNRIKPGQLYLLRAPQRVDIKNLCS